MPFTVIIPARYDSSRLPGKPLAPIAGRPMIAWVHERAQASGAAEVIIATDDERIREAAAGFGASVIMTDACHRSGTERLGEAVRVLGCPADTIIVNLQGDEPQMPPSLIGQVADLLEESPEADLATLCVPIRAAAELMDPAIVKVVVDARGFALYFSRAPIPWWRDGFASGAPGTLPAEISWFRHIGLYAYRARYLARYAQLPPSVPETLESLEQLRALHHGSRIRVGLAQEEPPPGIDTPEDLERFRRTLAGSG